MGANCEAEAANAGAFLTMRRCWSSKLQASAILCKEDVAVTSSVAMGGNVLSVRTAGIKIGSGRGFPINAFTTLS